MVTVRRDAIERACDRCMSKGIVVCPFLHTVLNSWIAVFNAGWIVAHHVSSDLADSPSFSPSGLPKNADLSWAATLYLCWYNALVSASALLRCCFVSLSAVFLCTVVHRSSHISFAWLIMTTIKLAAQSGFFDISGDSRSEPR